MLSTKETHKRLQVISVVLNLQIQYRFIDKVTKNSTLIL